MVALAQRSSVVRRTRTRPVLMLLVFGLLASGTLLSAGATGASTGAPYVAVETREVPDMIGPGQTAEVVFAVHVLCPTGYVSSEKGEMTFTHNVTGPATSVLHYDEEKDEPTDPPCSVSGQETVHLVTILITVPTGTEAYESVRVNLEANHTDTDRAATGSAHVYTGRVGQLHAEVLAVPDMVGQKGPSEATVRVTNHYNTPLEFRLHLRTLPRHAMLLTQSSYVIPAATSPEQPHVADIHFDIVSRPAVQNEYNETVHIRLEAWEIYSVAPIEEHPSLLLELQGIPDEDLKNVAEAPAPAIPLVLLGAAAVAQGCRKLARGVSKT